MGLGLKLLYLASKEEICCSVDFSGKKRALTLKTGVKTEFIEQSAHLVYLGFRRKTTYLRLSWSQVWPAVSRYNQYPPKQFPPDYKPETKNQRAGPLSESKREQIRSPGKPQQTHSDPRGQTFGQTRNKTH